MPTRRALLTITGSMTLCALLWTAARSQQNSLPPVLGAVLVGRDAYVLQPPEMIAGGEVMGHDVSTSGAYVLAVRKTPPRLPTSLTDKPSPATAETSLHFWDTADRKGGILWRGTSTEQNPLSLHLYGFLPNTNLALVHVGHGENTRQPESHAQVLLVNVAKRTVREIANSSTDDSLIMSRLQPHAALFSQDDKTMRIIQADGTISSPISFQHSWMEQRLYLLVLAKRRQESCRYVCCARGQ